MPSIDEVNKSGGKLVQVAPDGSYVVEVESRAPSWPWIALALILGAMLIGVSVVFSGIEIAPAAVAGDR